MIIITVRDNDITNYIIYGDMESMVLSWMYVLSTGITVSSYIMN